MDGNKALKTLPFQRIFFDSLKRHVNSNYWTLFYSLNKSLQMYKEGCERSISKISSLTF